MPSCTVKCRYKQLNINNDYNYALHKYLLYIKTELCQITLSVVVSETAGEALVTVGKYVSFEVTLHIHQHTAYVVHAELTLVVQLELHGDGAFGVSADIGSIDVFGAGSAQTLHVILVCTGCPFGNPVVVRFDGACEGLAGSVLEVNKSVGG